MVPPGEGDETGSPGGTSGHRGVAPGIDGDAGGGQNLSIEAGSKKRKATMFKDSNNLSGIGDLEVECEAPRRISMRIENLRSQLDEDGKELGYCEENEKLMAEMHLKDKEIQCLREQNEELQAEYKKQNEVLQANYEKQNEELKAKYERLNKELQAEYEKQIKDLQSKCKKQIEDQQTKYEKQNEEVQARNVGLHKNILCTLENQIDAKKRQLQQLEGLYSAMEFSVGQLEECKEILEKSCDEDQNSKLGDQSLAEESDGNGKVDDGMLKKQKLEMEVAKLDADIWIKMDKLGELLQGEKFIEDLCSTTVWKSIEANTELQGIRRKLIAVFNEMSTVTRRGIGLKRMGELNLEPFKVACQRKYGADEFEARAAALISAWQDEVKNPSWHPFKIVEIDGIMKALLDDDDPKLTGLCAEYGNDVCNAVKVAVAEINEYNPSGGFMVAELWNFDEGRKATVNEALKEVCKRLLALRKRRL